MKYSNAKPESRKATIPLLSGPKAPSNVFVMRVSSESDAKGGTDEQEDVEPESSIDAAVICIVVVCHSAMELNGGSCKAAWGKAQCGCSGYKVMYSIAGCTCACNSPHIEYTSGRCPWLSVMFANAGRIPHAGKARNLAGIFAAKKLDAMCRCHAHRIINMKPLSHHDHTYLL